MRVLRVLIGGIIATTSVVAATVGARPQTAQIAEGKQIWTVEEDSQAQLGTYPQVVVTA